MKVIIDIPEEEYMEIKRYYDNLPIYSTVEAELYYIAHGIPLPKGHGRLIDIKQVAELLVFGDYLKDNVKCGDITRILDMATIIDADKEDNDADSD